MNLQGKANSINIFHYSNLREAQSKPLKAKYKINALKKKKRKAQEHIKDSTSILAQQQAAEM